MWAISPSFCLSSSETLSTANSHPISWKSAQQLRNTVKLVVQKCYLAQQGSISCVGCQKGGEHHLLLSMETADFEKLSNLFQCILVTPYPTFVRHINFDAKAKLSEKCSIKVSYWGGLVMRMETHLDHTWNQSICFTQQASIYSCSFFPRSALRSRGNSFFRRSKALLSQSVCTLWFSLCIYFSEGTWLYFSLERKLTPLYLHPSKCMQHVYCAQGAK